MNMLTEQDLRRQAPSIYALEPWEQMSEKYRFIPTSTVLDALQDSGFYPVRAQQSSSRIPGKAEHTRHMIRLLLAGQDAPQALGDVIPEIILTNSHDGSAAYNIMLGLFRLACLNGMVASIGTLCNIRARHSGPRSIVQDVLDGSLSLFKEAPQVLNRVERFQAITLSPEEQSAYAMAAIPLLDSAITVTPEALLYPRRRADMDIDRAIGAGNGRPSAGRSLWKTFNVVQENIIKGGAFGRTTTGRRVHTRAVKSVDRDIRLNKALWTLTEEMARIKT